MAGMIPIPEHGLPRRQITALPAPLPGTALQSVGCDSRKPIGGDHGCAHFYGAAWITDDKRAPPRARRHPLRLENDDYGRALVQSGRTDGGTVNVSLARLEKAEEP